MSQFVKGQPSANPAGRPVGSVTPETLAKKAIRPHLETLVEKTVAAGLRGDAQAASAAISLYATLHHKRKAT